MNHMARRKGYKKFTKKEQRLVWDPIREHYLAGAHYSEIAFKMAQQGFKKPNGRAIDRKYVTGALNNLFNKKILVRAEDHVSRALRKDERVEALKEEARRIKKLQKQALKLAAKQALLTAQLAKPSVSPTEAASDPTPPVQLAKPSVSPTAPVSSPREDRQISDPPGSASAVEATHVVKSWRYLFSAAIAGAKTHDFRDMTERDYKVGDYMHFREFDQVAGKYTGREALFLITYLTDNRTPCAMSSCALDKRYGVLSIKFVKMLA